MQGSTSIRFISLLALSFLLAACEKPDAELVGPLWILESIEPEGSSRITPNPDRTYTLQFFADSTLVGVADCDDLGFSYWQGEGDIIKLADGGVTRRGCGDADLVIDKYFPTGFIRTIKITYEINRDKLSFHLVDRISGTDDANLNFETSE